MKHVKAYLALATFVSILLEESLTSCPSHGKKHYGFSFDADSCGTFYKVDLREHFDAAMEPNHQFNNLCQRLYKNAYVYGITSTGDIKVEDWWDTMTTYAGMVITEAHRVDDVYYGWFFKYYKIHKYTWYYQSGDKVQYVSGTRGYVDDGDTQVYGDHVHSHWWIFRSKWYNDRFNTGKYPKCSIVKVGTTGVYPHDIIECARLGTYENLWMLCHHDNYKDCETENIIGCQYINRTVAGEHQEGWYESHRQIKVPAEAPYGLDCTDEHIVGEKCTPVCSGSMTSWTQMKTKCAKGGKFTSVRYQAKTPDDNVNECSDKNPSCCKSTMVLAAEDCYEYDESLTVKLTAVSCKNGGKLQKASSGHNMCACKSGFKGITCEDDMCKDACKNGATCVAKASEPVCVCLPGFTGKQCEIALMLCSEEKLMCKNGGSCVWLEGNTGSYCKCPKEYGGEHCESKTEYCNKDTCNDNGVCHNVTETHSFWCRCNDGYTGKKCETSKENIGYQFSQFTEGQSPFYVYLGIGLSLTLLFLVCTTGTAIHHHRRKRRRGRHGSDMSSYSSAFSSRFASTLSRFSTFGSTKASSRMNSKTMTKSRAPSKSRKG